MNKRCVFVVLFFMFLTGMTACSSKEERTIEDIKVCYPEAHLIELSSESAKNDGTVIDEYDYTWHCDPSVNHDEVKNAPAEYYTGALPDVLPSVYIDHELYYYPQLEKSGFTAVNYDGEREYAYYYNDGVNNDYIFATLPMLGKDLPTDMMHSEEEAYENKVLHITAAGTYILSGNWKGQINIDLGETDDIFTDSTQKVTVVLAGCDINCSVAPGIIFKSVYECDNAWEDRGEADTNPKLSDAGAKIVIADGTENYITGKNVFRMLKTKYKDEDSTDEIKVQKKMRKTDGALYSYVSMVITGEAENTGLLTVTSGFEGVDSELHMEISGGRLVINSQDDGMNVNEDNVSVIKFSGGEVEINAALGVEGDGVDSNGYVRIDGGNININGIRVPDSAIDSEDGIYYFSGQIFIDGTLESHESGEIFRETGNMDEKPGNGPRGERPDGEFPGEPPKGGFDGKRPDGDSPGEPPKGGFDGKRPDGEFPREPLEDGSDDESDD